MASQPAVGRVEGVGPAFLHALEALVQAHIEELAQAPLADPAVLHAQQAAAKTAVEGSTVIKQDEHVGFTGVDVLALESSGSMKRRFLADSLHGTPQPATPICSLTAENKDDELIGLASLGVEWAEAVETINPVLGPAKGVTLFGNVKVGLSDGTEIDEPEYDVSRYYKKAGISQSIARSAAFGYVTLFFIFSHAVYMGIAAEHGNSDFEDPPVGIIFCDQFFCVFFFLEWLIRFMAFRRKRDCIRDAWFMFDTFLVFTMVVDTWLTRIVAALFNIALQSLPTGMFRLLRMMRLTRMVRLCHAFPELATLVKSIFVATRAVCFAVMLLVLIIYAWAIGMHSLLKDEAELFLYWGTIPRCMITLISNGTLGDSIGTVMRGIMRDAAAFTAFMIFVLLSQITVLNMVIGLLSEVVGEVARAEKEYSTLSRLKNEVLSTLRKMDKDNSGDISREEMLAFFADKTAKKVLADLNIDVKHLVELTDMIFHTPSDDAISIPQVMQLLLDSQGTRQPTYQDVVALLAFNRWSIRQELVESRSHILSVLGKYRQFDSAAHRNMYETTI